MRDDVSGLRQISSACGRLSFKRLSSPLSADLIGEFAMRRAWSYALDRAARVPNLSGKCC